MLRITKYGESILKTKGELIEVFDHALVDLADDMVDTMYEAHGIGLAAQQIDQAIMLCVIDVDPGEHELDFDYLLDGKKPPIDLIMPMALVNPVITDFSGEKEEEEEGCLSFPDIRGDVGRPIRIEVKFQDLEGEFHKLKCGGLFARCCSVREILAFGSWAFSRSIANSYALFIGSLNYYLKIFGT